MAKIGDIISAVNIKSLVYDISSNPGLLFSSNFVISFSTSDDVMGDKKRLYVLIWFLKRVAGVLLHCLKVFTNLMKQLFKLFAIF